MGLCDVLQSELPPRQDPSQSPYGCPFIQLDAPQRVRVCPHKVGPPSPNHRCLVACLPGKLAYGGVLFGIGVAQCRHRFAEQRFKRASRAGQLACGSFKGDFRQCRVRLRVRAECDAARLHLTNLFDVQQWLLPLVSVPRIRLADQVRDKKHCCSEPPPV